MLAATSRRSPGGQLLLQRLFGQTLSDHTSETEASNVLQVGKEVSLPSVSESVVSSAAGELSTCDDSNFLTIFDQRRTQALGKVLRATDERTRLLQRPQMPPITKICDNRSETTVSVGSTANKLGVYPSPTDGTQQGNTCPWVGRGFPSRPRIRAASLRTQQLGLMPQEGNVRGNRRGAMEQHKKCRGSHSAVEGRDAGLVPVRPATQSISNTPRPIWAVLRRQTLKTTEEDPSIFSRGVQHRPKKWAQADPTIRQIKSWHIINRRIFGVYETPRKRGTTSPEWLLFAGGVPTPGISERQRWMLRLGRDYSDDVRASKS